LYIEKLKMTSGPGQKKSNQKKVIGKTGQAEEKAGQKTVSVPQTVMSSKVKKKASNEKKTERNGAERAPNPLGAWGRSGKKGRRSKEGKEKQLATQYQSGYRGKLQKGTSQVVCPAKGHDRNSKHRGGINKGKRVGKGILNGRHQK